MSILSRYIMFQFFRMVGICQAGAITLFLMAEFIERIDDLVEKKAALIDGVLYFLFKIPQLVIFSIPLTVLLKITANAFVLFTTKKPFFALSSSLSIFTPTDLENFIW